MRQPAAGPLRPYAVTGGRARPSQLLQRQTLVQTASSAGSVPLTPEGQQVRELCRQPRAVAEIAPQIGQPLQVAKVLLSDLLDAGALRVAFPRGADRSDPQLLEAVLVGLRNKLAG